MFFTHSFQFRMILELFDQKDGLRKLLNYVLFHDRREFHYCTECAVVFQISTLTILQVENPESGVMDGLSEDQMYQSRQAVRNVCTALRK